MGGKTGAKKLDIFTITWLFVIFSLFGFIFEGFWSVISFGRWEDHYSLVWGPFTIIYGFAVVGLLLLYPFLGQKNFVMQFLGCFLLGSAFEFCVSFLQEFAFHTRSWDYSHLPYNLDGRICLRMSLVWGLVGLVLLRLVAPKMSKFLKYFKGRIMQTLGFALFIFMICNFAVSILATNRYSERHYGVGVDSHLDVLLDDRFPDERMRTVYYNMFFVD